MIARWFSACTMIAAAIHPLGAVRPACRIASITSEVVSRLLVRGVITTEDDLPLEGVLVTASGTGGVLASARSDERGLFSFTIDGTAARYELRFARIGYAPETRAVMLGAHDSVATFGVRMRATAQQLSATHTVAPRPNPVRDGRGVAGTPGANQQQLDIASGLSGDVSGDPTAALAMLPGVSLIPTADGLAASAYGMPSDANASTLNGADMGAMSLPRDGLVGVAHLSTYDPRIGRFAGVQTSWTLPPGWYLAARSLRATVDQHSLQLAPPAANALGTRFDNAIVSGTGSGELGGSGIYYNSAFQVGQVNHALSTLNDANALGLSSLGVAADSVTRLFAAARAVGLETSPQTMPANRTTTSASAIARVDLLPAFQFRPLSSSGTLFYLLGAGSMSTADGLGASPLAAATSLTKGTARSGQALVDFETYVGGVLSANKSSVTVQQATGDPLSRMPVAAVLVNSVLPNGQPGLATLRLGGSGGAALSSRTTSFETSSDWSWMTRDRRHSFDVYGDAKVGGFTSSVPSDAPGVFTFNSIADFQAGHASTFSRNTSAPLPSLSAWDGVLAISDIVGQRGADGSPTRNGVSAQLGLRLERTGFLTSLTSDSSVERAFGRPTNRVPGSFDLAPMVGFTWNAGTYIERSGSAIYSDPRSTLSGGIRKYSSSLTPQRASVVLDQSSTAFDATELSCVGQAVPAADWRALETAPPPASCANGASTVPLSISAPSVSYYAPGFNAPESWRGELNWRWLFSGYLSGSLGITDAVNTELPDPFDVNFVGRQRFALNDEGGRPVFVDGTSIDPSTGAVSYHDSRTDARFGHVTELRSDLGSSQRMATAALSYRIGSSAFASPAAEPRGRTSGAVSASYTYTDTYAQSRGFSATSAGDPRVVGTSGALSPKHTFQVFLTLQRTHWFTLTASGRLSSGMPFTPMVAQDINGDGYANDRAFVFAPDAGTASPIGISELYGTAPRYAQRCLERQIGRIAGQSSCFGPWSASLGTIAFTPDAYRIGLGTRGAISLYANNLLGGIDQILHGASRMHGWGQPAIPDATLLYVRGFDVAASRFVYQANPDFGSVSTTRSLLLAPFRLTLDVRLDIGPNRETQFIKSRFADPPLGGGVPRDASLLKQQLIAATHLRRDDIEDIVTSGMPSLTAAQRDSIEQLRTSYLRERDSIYAALAQYLVDRRGAFDGPEVRQAWHDAIAASSEKSFAVAMSVRRILADSQIRWLEARGLAEGLDESPDWLARVLKGPLLLPR